MRSYRKYSEVYDFVLARAIAGKERSSRSPTKKHSIPNRRDNVRGVALAIPPFASGLAGGNEIRNSSWFILPPL